MSDASAPARALGVDIGGSAIKSAPVDVVSGRLLRPRQRVLTPNPSTPKAGGEVVGGLARRFDWHGAVGCAFPAIVKHGWTLSAANVDASWIETDADAVLTEATGCPVTVINDADAAGVAEMRLGRRARRPFGSPRTVIRSARRPFGSPRTVIRSARRPFGSPRAVTVRLVGPSVLLAP